MWRCPQSKRPDLQEWHQQMILAALLEKVGSTDSSKITGSDDSIPHEIGKTSIQSIQSIQSIH
jgi:hypothetical protein